MKLHTLRRLGGASLVLALCAGVAAVLPPGTALAGSPPVEGSAAMASPAKNAAVVNKLVGLVNNRHEKTLQGLERTINDGVVIRKSSIKDGKIVIPPEGLYTTARSGNFFPFDGEPITIAGNLYRIIVDRYVRDVVRDVVMKKGDIVKSNADQSRGWELTDVEGWDLFGLKDGKAATFKVVKTTGNYYGQSFTCRVGTSVSNAASDGSLVNGSDQPLGHTVPDEENNLSRFDYCNNVATVGRSYVVVEKIDEENAVHVRELATDSCTDLFMSPATPVVGTYRAGDSYAVGGYMVSVLAVDEASVDLALTDNRGKRTEAKLYIDPKNSRWLVQSMVERNKCFVVSDDGSVIVHLNIRPGNPFENGTVQLVSYPNVVRVTNGCEWFTDSRFIARPET